MTTTACADNSPRASPRRQDRAFDMLVEPFEADGVVRVGCHFSVERPWAVARFGKVMLKRGWWVFECAGEGDVGAVELRLVSPEDTLLAFSLRRASYGKAMFPVDRTFDVSLLVSAWPGKAKLPVLRFRRMSKAEVAWMVGVMLLRLVRSERPLSKVVHVVNRALSGRSLRIQTPVAAPTAGVHAEPVRAREARFVTLSHCGVTAVLRADERLHPRAWEIASAAFDKSQRLEALLADVDQDGLIRPRPIWDRELATTGVRAQTPVFFRGDVEAVDPAERLRAISRRSGAIERVALPLAYRPASANEIFEPPAVPRLTRTPIVSIIIPTKTQLDLLERCLSALAEQTDYSSLDIVLVDNGADQVRLGQILSSATQKLSIRKVDDFGPFNFPRLVNFGVRNSHGEIVLLLNDDVEAVESGWLRRMVQSVMSEDVGCVGARLLYPDRRIQHAGVTLGLSGVCGHLWKGLGEDEARQIPQVVLPSERMAVTGACLALKRETFDKVGGLDEQAFPVAFNDIDLCLRVRMLGLRTVYRGDAILIHHESQSRGSDDASMKRRKALARETAAFLDRWGNELGDDPFGSPAFDPVTESGAIHPSLGHCHANRE